MRFLRALLLLLGVVLLLIGFVGITIDVITGIDKATNQDTNRRPISTFPTGTIYAMPFLGLGCYLVFRNRVKAPGASHQKRMGSN
jgi:hypothetical protein